MRPNYRCLDTPLTGLLLPSWHVCVHCVYLSSRAGPRPCGPVQYEHGSRQACSGSGRYNSARGDGRAGTKPVGTWTIRAWSIIACPQSSSCFVGVFYPILPFRAFFLVFICVSSTKRIEKSIIYLLRDMKLMHKRLQNTCFCFCTV